jgi:ribA/ribD-fused uncharacterized protein
MISKFEGKYEFLSNFYPVIVSYESFPYASVEHAYQAAKSEDKKYRAKVFNAATAKEAKRLGKRAKLREDWEQVKVGIMRGLLRQKFNNPELRALLDATKGQELIEGNWWGDKFWGQSPVGEGENWLGKLLMEIRDGEHV